MLCIYLYSQEHVHSILTVTQNQFTVKQQNPAQYVLELRIGKLKLNTKNLDIFSRFVYLHVFIFED